MVMREGPLIIRPALASDLPAIVALMADDDLGAAREDATLPLDPRYARAFDAIDRDPNQLLAVATEGDELIGTLHISFVPSLGRKGAWRADIKAVRIASHLRGQGLGKRLFTWAVAQCRGRGCEIMQLTTDKTRTDAHRFYEQLGFTASHVGYKRALT